MREGQVAEQALIDALAPPAAASPDAAASVAEPGMRTRSFGPVVRPAAAVAGTAAVAAQPGKASILVTFVTNSADRARGARSALDVLAYLLGQQGMAADRVQAVGKGSTALMNTSDPAAPENRRVTIVAQPG